MLLFLAGLVAGAVNAVAGGGSLISFPALLSVGYGAVPANVTNTVAVVPGYLGGTVGYRPELKGQGDRIIFLGIISAAGGLTGAILLLVGPASVFRSVVPWLILFACALLAAQPWVTRWVATIHAEHGSTRITLGAAQFLGAVYGGYFGAGLGVMMLAVLGILIPDNLQRLNALKGLLSLVINLVSALFFVCFGPVAWPAVAIMVVASLVGGNLGVHAARRMSPTALRGLVILLGTAVAVRLLV